MNPKLLLGLAKKKLSDKKGDSKAANLASKGVNIWLKKKFYLIALGIVAAFLLIIVVIAIISFMLGLLQQAEERFRNTASGACIFCSNEDLEKKKLEQFRKKIDNAANKFGEKIDRVVLASTVLYQGNYYDVLDQVYDKDYNDKDYNSWLDNLKKFMTAGVTDDDGYNGIEQKEIDSLDAAIIIMNNAAVDGKYNEENYKKALVSSGYGSNNFLVNGYYCLSEGMKKAEEGMFKSIPIVGWMATLSENTFGYGSGGNANDVRRSLVESIKICQKGYIGGTFKEVEDMDEGNSKEVAKKKIAQEIIDFAEFYKYLFPEEEDDCLYNGGSAGSGDSTNWRQCDSKWGSDPLGRGGGATICSAGCLMTSITYLIDKSGTATTVSNLDPQIYNKKGAFSGALLVWDFTPVAPNFKRVGNGAVNFSNAGSVISNILNDSSSGHQKFVVLTYSQAHWVAVDHVENGQVYIMDPSGPEGAGLIKVQDSPSYTSDGNALTEYVVLEATDVPFGGNNSSKVITASNKSSNKATGGDTVNSKVDKYLQAMKLIAEDNSHGYSMAARNGPDYDCSSFIYYSLLKTGIIGDEGYAFATGNEGEVLKKNGFEEIPYDRSKLQPGDIIVDPRMGAGGHTVAIYSNENGKLKEIAAHYNIDGVQGDSSGEEISIADFDDSSHVYTHIYRLTGANTSNSCTTSSGSGKGDVVIPEPYGAGGYTVTLYDTQAWAAGTNQKKIYDQWLKNPKTKDGIAMIDDRFLIACTSVFGKVGDKVDFFLDDGTKIPTIIADAKAETVVPWDPHPANKWGHNDGANVLEFQVTNASYYAHGSNPGTSGWYPEWGGKRVASATNLGSIW